MHTHFVTSPVSLSRLHATPCWPYLDGYCDWLAAKHYTPATIRLYLFGIVPLGRWMMANAVAVAAFDRQALENFRRQRASVGKLHRDNGRKLKAAFMGARRFHEHLNGRVSARSGHPKARPGAGGE